MAIQALVMGFGGTGAHILTFLKELTVLKYGNRLDSVRFLLFDTIADWRPGSTVRILGGAAEEKLAVGREEGTSLDPNTEYFYLADHDPDLSKHVFELLGDAGDPQSYPHLKDWLHTPWLSLHVPSHQLTIKEGAAQQRQIGRFAMFQNSERIVRQIEKEIRRLRDRARGGVINVWVIGSAAGGTGAGCLLDAAFFARAAARDVAVNLTGVIVLPEVYDDKEGISPGRAYSLFRELDRFQEQGCGAPDRFVDTNKMISSRVGYDARRRLESSVPSRLFDYLFYAGQTCRNDGARMSFFTSVANAIDPFLDEESGPTLLQSSVNSFAAASSFGAARLYIPVETYGDLFAWEEVAKYIEAAAAPRRADIVVDLHHGSIDDRQRDGRARVESLLPLFKTVLELAGKTEKELEQFARLLSPAAIVKEWYGFGGAAVAGLALTPAEQQVALLTYVNPYISWTEDDPGRVPAKDRNLKTYEENREARGPRESREESRDRFAKELGIITERYRGRDAGDRTFEKGRRLVFEKLSRLLAARVDELVLNELTQKPQFARDADVPEQGTVMTRLFQELKEILGDDGFLARIDGTVSGFIAAMQGEESFRQGEAVRAVKDLTEWAPAGMFRFGATVEGPQGSAREASGDYLTAFQKFRLLQDMQRLVREVKARFEAWAGLVRRGFEGLALDVAASSYTETGRQLRRLDGRLGRLADNPTALISCAERDPRNPDVRMQGFADRLRQACVMPDGRFSLADAALAASSWQVSVDVKARPQLELVVRLGEQERRFTTDSIAQLHRELHDHFRGLIDPRLEQFDIFDYLLYAQESPRNVQPEQIAQRLNAAAEVLINAEAPETCTLIYTDPVASGKRNLAGAILREVARSLGNRDVAESHHSDRFALTLLKVRKPNLDAIQNIADCRDDYLLWQGAGRNGHQEHDEELFRAQVYHPFRPELEAWYIERRQSALDQRGISARDHLPPRIVRLLEDPAMMQAFVHCVATGAVEKSDGSWLWHDAVNGRDVFLTEREAEPRADLLRAAIVFVLQQREGRRQGRIPIRLEDARKSAVQAAQKRELSRDEALSQFLKQQLDGYLRDHFPIGDDEAAYERELRGLHVLFEFYCHPQTQTQLRERLDLGHRV
jgi:hypothetical protein